MRDDRDWWQGPWAPVLDDDHPGLGGCLVVLGAAVATIASVALTVAVVILGVGALLGVLGIV